MTGERFTRLQLLAATGTGLVTVVAGCGYQPGGGEFDWHINNDDGSRPPNSSDSLWLTDDHLLFRIRTRSGMTADHNTGHGFELTENTRVTAYDASGSTDWHTNTASQYVGTPAVADGRVYLALEDGSVTALERPPENDDNRGDSDARWTVDWDGSTLSLHATDGLVVGVFETGLVCFDADDGDEQFTVEGDSLGTGAIDAVATATEQVWAIGESTDDDHDAQHTLYGITGDGDIRTTVSLPSAPAWLEAMGTDALLGIDDTIWAIAADGDRRFAVDLEGDTGPGAPILVGERNRLYHYTSGTLEAVDIAAETIAWHRADYSFRSAPVANTDGIYGQGTGPDMDSCGLVAVATDGDQRWGIPSLEALDCTRECSLIDDRLVVIDGSDAYGFRTEPGRRWTVG